MSHSRKTFLLSLILSGVGFLGLTLLPVPSGGSYPVQSALAADAPPSFANLAEEMKHTVVNVFTTRVVKGRSVHPFFTPDSPFKDFFGEEFKRFFGDQPRGEMRTQALGSGFIIDGEGLILTNNHVVEKADEIRIKVELGKEYAATVVGRDPKTDLALIRVKPDADFPKPARLGDSDAIRVGDWVVAVGNPFGLGHTVTSGIISAKGRVIGAGPYDDFLQTDAAINPGNSGGPLCNMAGEVVGINTAIVAQGQGIGFAIPIGVAKQLIPQLKSGKVIRGWLGVAIQDLTPELSKALDLGEQKGVLIGDVVEGGPAEKAGLKRGDVIVSFAGKPIETAHMLSSTVAGTAPDSTVKVELLREGKKMNLDITLGTMPEEPALAAAVEDETRWGLTVRALTPELADRFGYKRNEEGVVVAEVQPGSAAADAGLQMGDLIREVNRQKVTSLEDFKKIVGGDARTLLFLVKRGENTFYVPLRKEADK